MLMAARHTGLKTLVNIIGAVLVMVVFASLTYLAYEMVKTGRGLDTFPLPMSRAGLWRTYTSWLVDASLFGVAVLAAVVASLWYRYRRRPTHR